MATYVLHNSPACVGNRTPSQGFFVYGDDFPLGPRSTTKTISGHVYDTNGTVVVGATVDLYRQIDGKKMRSTTSATGGVYSFPRDAADTLSYYTVAWTLTGGSTQVHGTSNRGLVPL